MRIFDILPTDLLVLVLSSWLHVKDIVSLDSALTSKEFRNIAKIFLQLPFCSILEWKTARNRRSCPLSLLNWIHVRKFRLASMSLGKLDESLGETVKELLRNNFSGSVKISNLQGDIYSDTALTISDQVIFEAFNSSASSVSLQYRNVTSRSTTNKLLETFFKSSVNKLAVKIREEDYSLVIDKSEKLLEEKVSLE